MIPGSILAGGATLLRRVWPYALAVGLIAGAWAYADHRGYQRGADDVRAEWGAASLAAATKALNGERANRAEEARRHAAQMEAVEAHAQEMDGARRDAAGAVAAGDRLRAQIGGIIAACRTASNPAPAGGGAAAGSALDLLPELQRRLDEAADAIARHADAARAAGRACERSYDALTAGES
ncbi:Protein of unknown function [Sphingomonas laterariae]|uniref:DUF2514 domain-containing protein n=1 Tax=Edaphosphingomonas laterariae TaxID=861865 RepID=A0A239F790_9SPHN|nr:DUF2514 family protein [Sphingomonas laterariae]SNS52910.1 Protein of unknown function [Sphingomonas laterariae]